MPSAVRLRATHAIELPFLWEFAAPGLRAFAGSKAPDDLGPCDARVLGELRAHGHAVRGRRAGLASLFTVPDRPVLTLDAERRIAYDLDAEVRRFWFA